MCGFLKKIFGGNDNSAELLGLMRSQQAEAKRANDLALEAAERARRNSEAAMVSPADSESARRAAENRMRRALRNQGPETMDLGAAPVSYKMLFGA